MKFLLYCLLWLFSMIHVSCAVPWTRALQYGEIGKAEFSDTVDIEIKNGLVFVPVRIDGAVRRFLFDTGAPLSISQELQNIHHFRAVSKGHIVDSDKNRIQVEYVRLDTLYIAKVLFSNHTAFVGDLTANPLLDCLDIDGIIGSNLMRRCTWTIDQEAGKLYLSSNMVGNSTDTANFIPFRTDSQFNILMGLRIGSSVVRNLMVDYGSNGSISLPKDVWSVLKQRGVIGRTLTERGVKQSGIAGQPVHLNREISYMDSVRLGNLVAEDVELRTGSSALIGNKLLSRFIVTIDWHAKRLYLREGSVGKQVPETYGFRVGYTLTKGIYIQSVVEGTEAYTQGIRPDMQVLRANAMDFRATHGFCDYVALMDAHPQHLMLELLDSAGQRWEFRIARTNADFNR